MQGPFLLRYKLQFIDLAFHLDLYSSDEPSGEEDESSESSDNE